VIRDGQLLPEELPVSRLAEFVTERGNPGNIKRITSARLEIPLPFLRQGLEFVDTPGVGSSIDANTDTAYQFLPQCDAVIFVTSVDSPLSKTELDFLMEIRHNVHRIFFVVNKIDLLNPEERKEVLDFVQNSLVKLLGDPHVMVFPVSALQGLEAKRTGSRQAYADSGLRDFEESLACFLTAEKSATFLDSLLDKAIAFLPASQPDLHPAMGETEDYWHGMRKRLQEARSRLGRQLRQEETINGEDSRLKLSEREGPESVAIETKPEEKSSETTVDLHTRGCPICNKLSDRMFDYFRKWQYVLATDESAQAAFAIAGGFCSLHTWQLVSIASPHGLSTGLPVLMEHLSRQLSGSVHQKEAISAVSLPRRNDGCPACQFLLSEEQKAISQLSEIISTDSGRALYHQSQGVCLPHLKRLISEISSDSLRRDLIEITARRCDEWAEDMQNYAMKRDAIRWALLNKDEEDAYYRAITHLVGARSLCLPPPVDDSF